MAIFCRRLVDCPTVREMCGGGLDVTEEAWLDGAGVRGGLSDENGGRMPGEGGAFKSEDILINVGLF